MFLLCINFTKFTVKTINMYHLGELVVSNYIPEEIVPGMLFVNTFKAGTDRAHIELWENKARTSQVEEFCAKYGYPVRLMIVDPQYEDDVLAEHEQIAWFDEGDHTDEYRDITLKDINTILQDHEGFVEVEIDDFYEAINPTLYEGKVIIRAL